MFGNIGWEENASTLNLSLTLADNELLGNGALPIELLEEERSTVFTHPDRTENNMLMANLRSSHAWSDNVVLASTVYYRRNNVKTFNRVKYETFGLFGEADEVLGDEFEDSRFLSPGAPRAAWIGLELIF